jgi:DNA-binding CsgD family transcriptional regulator/PAS domain-containing protein
MLEDLPLLNSLTPREIQVIEALLGGPQLVALNGHSRELEASILNKTKTNSLEELVSLLHREVIRSNILDSVKQISVDHFLKDPRFERFQVFADQGVRILDNSTHQYLYVNDATTNIIGWTPEEIKQGGLLFGHRKTHPWDLLQIVLLSAKVLRRWKTLTDEDKLHSRFSYDIRIRHKNGEYRRIQQHAYTLSVTEDGKPGLLMMVSNDITPYKSGTKIQYVFGVTRGTRFDILLNGETRPHSSPLTERETEIVHLISEGHTENGIAEKLRISVQTIKTHRKNILLKTNCKNSAELIRTAMMEGWI